MAEFTNVNTRKQSKPKQSLCGNCGREVARHELICNDCLAEELRPILDEVSK